MRPNTPDVVHADGHRTIHVKRICIGCGESLGDVTKLEIEAAVNGWPLPDTSIEHGSQIMLFHGGAPGLKAGDIIQPGHKRKTHDGCSWCIARESGQAGMLDPQSKHQDKVYVTSDRLYAKYYASLYGYGDLYRVRPVNPTPSDEDSIESFSCDSAVVVSVLDRAVLLTWNERRRLFKNWGRADREAVA